MSDDLPQGDQGRGDPLDEAVLARLIELAGPSDGPELMRRLIGDMGDVSAGISTSFAIQDREAMRRHTHVLLGVAGTIGAQQIYQLAGQLNQCAKDDTCVQAGPQAMELVQRLSGLIRHLQLLSGQMGMV